MFSKDGYTLKMTLEPDGLTIPFKKGLTVLEAAGKAGIEIESICAGRGLCGKCRIRVISRKEQLPPLTAEEKKTLRDDEIKHGYRLACMVKPRLDLAVYIPSRSKRGSMRLQTEGLKVGAPLKPMIKKYCVEIPKPGLEDQRSDEDRLLEALNEKYHLDKIIISYYAVSRLPSVLRKSGWKTTAVVWDNKIIDVEPGDTSSEGFGVALDVGTSKIALYLLDLIDGKELTTVSMVNPQRSFGEDIMTRMSFANRKEANLEKLHEMVIDALNKLIFEACSKAGVSRSRVYEAVLVGNTVMHHFLLKLQTRYLSQSPYTQVLRRPFDCSPSTIGLQINQNGNVHALPTIRSFVGADNVAVCLVTKIAEAEKPVLALDIGTNTEIDCGSGGTGLTVTSTPSGPAFEGWATKWGMTATSGAIERIFIDPDTFEIVYRTVGDRPPLGICGSGYVDAIAEMMKAGILSHRTEFNDVKSNRIRKGEAGHEIVIAREKESNVGKDIVVTQKDIREIVKAKAAIHSAITILLSHLKLAEDRIDKFFLAGAFGSYIDPENARTIGILPDLDLERIVPIGNAAGTGAKLALLNTDERHDAEEISAKAVFIELATHPMFVKEYVNSMYLPYKVLDKYPKTMNLLRNFRSID